MDLYHNKAIRFKLSRQQKVEKVPRKAYCGQVRSRSNISNIEGKYNMQCLRPREYIRYILQQFSDSAIIIYYTPEQVPLPLLLNYC